MTKYAPCVGCGYCCSKAPCWAVANLYGMAWTSPCPELRRHDDRYWCGLVEDAEGQCRRDLMKDLAMGAGCPSTLFNSARDAIKKGFLDGGN